MSLHILILIMVDTWARMFPFLWDGVGEDIITTMEIIADFAMGGIQGGIVVGIRDGTGKRALVRNYESHTQTAHTTIEVITIYGILCLPS
jgi:hypothetical protein